MRSVVHTSFFEPGQRYAFDELFLSYEENDEYRQRGDRGSGHELPPVDAAFLLEHGKPILQCPYFDTICHNEGPQIVVPAPHEGEYREGGQCGF